MTVAQGLLDGVVRTFGPFLIPAAVFAAGFVGYTTLLLLNRSLGDEEEGRVNLSTGLPEESTTTNDHGASDRGISPGDGSGDDEETEEYRDPTD